MVRSITLEVRWHNVCPIYSCHFQSIGPAHLRRVLEHNAAQAAGLPLGKSVSGETVTASAASSSKHALPPIMPGGQSWRLATAGGDNNARIWMVHPNMPSPAAMAAAAGTADPALLPAPHPPRVEYLATLSRHTGVVNVVRFCPKGELLATAGDDGNVLFWIPSDKLIESMSDDPNSYEKEHWRVRTMTRPTNAEIYDLAWAPSGEQLIVGGTDFALRVINAVDGSILREISEHCHHIQGVAWDPLNEFLATQSSDRTVHVHQILPRASNSLTQAHGHAHDSHTNFSGLHNISRNSHLTHHRRTGSSSASAIPVPPGPAFVWDHTAKPPMQRRGSSHASVASESGIEAGADPRTAARSRSGRSSTPFESAIAGTSTHLPPTNQLPGATMLSPSMISASLPAVPGPSPAQAPTRAPSAATTGLPALPPPAGAPPLPTSSNSITMGHPRRSVTPTPAQSVPPSPFSHASAMNPPQLTPSRRSSFSGSAIEAPSPPMTAISISSTTQGGASASQGASGSGAQQLSASTHSASGGSAAWTPATSVSAVTSSVPKPPASNASGTLATGVGAGGFELRRSESRARSARSSSPMPLPAIRAPPSPKQRLQHVLGAGGSSGGGSMGAGAGAYAASSANLSFSGSGIGQILRTRMYGDENYSGFFRRLNFSPDGALLVTPSGIFEGGPASGALPHPPASPTASTAGGGGIDASPTGAAGARASSAKAAAMPSTVGGHALGLAGVGQPGGTARSTVYMYARGSLHKSNAPIAHFPGHKTATLVVSFSPILYELRNIRRPGAAAGDGVDEGVAPHLTVPLEAGKHKVVPLSSLGRAFSGTATTREEDAAPLPPSRPHPHGHVGSADLRRQSSSQNSTPSASGLASSADVGGPSTGTPKPSATTMPSPSGAATGATPQPAPPSMIGLPYRMIFAVATQESVWIYDTQQTGPLCCFSNMHYASFTDLTWSPDGQTLVMSSTDGYCSVVVFDYGELGTPYGYTSQPALAPPHAQQAPSHAHASLAPSPSPSAPASASASAGKKVDVSPRSAHASTHAYGAVGHASASASAALSGPVPWSASASAAPPPPPSASPSAPASAGSINGGASGEGAKGSSAPSGGLGLALQGDEPPPAAAAAEQEEGGAIGAPDEEQPKKKRRIAPTPVAL